MWRPAQPMRYRCGQFLAIAWSRISPCSGSEDSSPGSRLHFLAHHDAHNLGSSAHFIGVGVSALIASFAALALTLVGVRRQDGRVVLVGSAFTVMAALLAIHGLATPGVVIGNNGVISLTGAATLPVGGAVLALSALPALRRPQGIRALLVLQGVALIGVIGLGVVGMAVPSLVPASPRRRADRRSSPSSSASCSTRCSSCGR